MRPGPAVVPRATYRVQLHRGFRLADVETLLDYFDALGISHVYLSPLGRARKGSAHGYDVIDPAALDPEIGTELELDRLSAACRERGMGLILDVVPNHMCVASSENAWWSDVLENGPSSPFARYFDIDWDPPKPDLKDKVLLPVLGEQYGRVLEQKEIQIEREGGTFRVRYFDQTFPLAPKTWVRFLGPARERAARIRGEDDAVLELESIETALAHLPSRSERDPEKVRERQREKEIVKQRLTALLERDPELARDVDREIDGLNGSRGEPGSFDRLESLLAEQAYRLSFWRVACEEINYRRFFDVNELAAIRVEDPDVHEAVHRLAFRWIEEGKIEGLRVDHVDGLHDPLEYLRTLPPRAFVVVEKVLVGDEALSADWPVQGTTGYEFLNAVDRLFVDPAARGAFRRLFRGMDGAGASFGETVYEAKKLVLQVALSAELTVLSRKLDRLSERHRSSRDFTLRSLHDALAEVIACFPVYRTYLRRGEAASDADRKIVERALKEAKRRNPSTSESLFDFVGSLLLGGEPDAAPFVASFQQLTGPVMAKGLEDTALYRYPPLASLAEVGGDPDRFGIAIDDFHERNLARRRTWPHALSASSTHDTKRDEDVRARLHALSEIPDRWEAALTRFRELNFPHREVVEEGRAPDDVEEYLLYQTLLGIWPAPGRVASERDRIRERVRAYAKKALREAKRHTSWVNPREDYERAVDGFVCRILDPAAEPFLSELGAFAASLSPAGHWNAVSQALVKIASPGVPDFYQGTELPEFRLVDPDNRAPVDFERRRRALRELGSVRDEDVRRMVESPEDGRLKLFVIRGALECRRAQPELFSDGDYLPLSARGARENHVVAFARRREERVAIAVVSRFFRTLPEPPLGASAWGDTAISVDSPPGSRFRDALTGIVVEPTRSVLPLARVLARLPVALLEKVA